MTATNTIPPSAVRPIVRPPVDNAPPQGVGFADKGGISSDDLEEK